jgi:hypothetical protein
MTKGETAPVAASPPHYTLWHILFLTDESFINFDDPATAAQRRKLARAEGFTNAVR